MTIYRTFFGITAKALIVFALIPYPSFMHAQLWSPHQKSTLVEKQPQMQQLPQSVGGRTAVAFSNEDGTLPIFAAKKPDVVRIGVILPINKLDDKGQLNDGEPWRTAELQLLAGPTLEAIALKSILPEQALKEAELLACDYVLTTTITQQPVQTQGRFSRLSNMRTLQAAATAAQFVPGVSSGANVANMAVSTLASQGRPSLADGLPQQVKANSEIIMEYRLTDAHSKIVLSGTEKQRSGSDGYSVVTGMITTVASKVAAAATR
ncbi:hypothetical protein [Terriglobus sp. TAA 43]|uniref:hypothetical protein n=1 Tax=Terriglobus sp. TAA 43 TaxID=278961 RepID=UPI000645F920|nr:hypothetical protein [Terriglobus sp. TAA 43]